MFTYLSHREILQNALVCKKWHMISQDPRLWTFVSLRPEISGLHVDRADVLLKLINTKFKELRYLELTTELITPQVRKKPHYAMTIQCHSYSWADRLD